MSAGLLIFLLTVIRFSVSGYFSFRNSTIEEAFNLFTSFFPSFVVLLTMVFLFIFFYYSRNISQACTKFIFFSIEFFPLFRQCPQSFITYFNRNANCFFRGFCYKEIHSLSFV